MTDIERRIKKIIETISGVSSSEIESWTTAEHLGLDSFDGVELIMEIEKEFAISITDNEAEKMNTVSDVVSYIEKKIAMEQNVTDPDNYEKIILDEIAKQIKKRVNRNAPWRSSVYVGGLVNTLNNRFGVKIDIDDSKLNTIRTIGQLVDYIIPQIADSSPESVLVNNNVGTNVETEILRIITQVTGYEANINDTFYDVGITSYAIKTKLKNAFNERFGLSLYETSLNFGTIEQLVDYLQTQIPQIDRSTSEVDSVEEQVTEKNENDSNSETTNNDTNNMSKKYEWAITPDKNKHEYVIGIDFGHGETSAAYCSIGWDSTKGQLSAIKDIDFGSNNKVIPSAISITTDDKAYIGDAAFLPEVLNKAEAKVCFKKKPENINGESERLMMRFMKEVYKTIRERNSALFTEGNHLVYIATPSGWDEEAKDLYGKMASEAGLPMGGITSESRAAFIKAQQDPDSGLPQYIDKGAIVFDMGSSTLDFTYLTRDNKNPIDWGDNCGASKVEKIIYESKRDGNEEILDFEKKYPNLVDALLFEARKAKEKVYFHPDMPCRITVNFETIVEDEEFEDTKMKFKYQPGELNQMLEEKGYIGAIRNAMMVFKNEKIAGKPIHVAFLTGGASRMDFIRDLVKECWGLPDDRIYRDQDPSLTISQGVAVLGRGDIRSGGSQNTKDLLKEITANAGDIFTPFAAAFSEKLTDEMQRSVITAFNEFKDSSVDVSLNDLKGRIKEWIESDNSQIGTWASECYQKTFEEKTADIRTKLDAIVSEFSNTSVQMGNVNNLSLSLPNLDMSEISGQMAEVGTAFAEEAGSITDLAVSAAVGGAVGLGVALLGGPLAWAILGGGYLMKKLFFDEEETEEDKKRKAMAKDLNKEARQQVYDSFFNEKWDEVSASIAKAVEKAVYKNSTLKKKINEQSKKVIMDYAQECINQTRLMVE